MIKHSQCDSTLAVGNGATQHEPNQHSELFSKGVLGCGLELKNRGLGAINHTCASLQAQTLTLFFSICI